MLIWSFIGNTVKTGRARRCDLDLRLPFSGTTENPFSRCCHCFRWNGKAAARAGESEDLPELISGTSFAEGGVSQQSCVDKKGKSPGRILSVRVFLFLDLGSYTFPFEPSPLNKWSAGDGGEILSPMKNSKRSPFYFVFLMICALGTPPAFAESETNTPTLGTVVVTANSEETPFETGDVETEESTGFVSVIQRKDFEGKMEDLADVLQNEAAVEVRQSGGLGSFSTISIRGSSSDQVMVFMDGVLLNDASGGGVDLSSISLSDVESIEIYRGISPINFDKASIGGVVNIKTLRAKEGVNASATAGYGSFDTRKASAFVNQKSGKWDYLVSAGYLASHNDFKVLNNNGTEWNPDDDKWETRNNAQFDQGNMLGKFGYDLTDDLRLALVNQWYSKEQGLPSWNNSPKTDASFNTQRNITTLSFLANNLGPLRLNTRTNIDYSYKNELYDDSHGQIGLGKQKTRYITDRYGGNFFAEWIADWNTMSFLADFHQETYSPENLLNDRGDPNQSSRDTLSFGLQDSLLLFEETLNITPGLRYTYIQDELKSATTAWGAPLEGEEKDEGYWSPQIGMKYSPLYWFSLKGNLARYVREPSFSEMFGDRGFIIGNPDLKAETGVNFDAGFRSELAFPKSMVQAPFSEHGLFRKQRGRSHHLRL